MKKKLLITMTIIWILFIFFNSLQSGIVSAGASGRVVSIVYDVFSWIGIDIQIGTLSNLIRKLAHIFEYFVLAILVTLIVFDMNITPKYKYIYSLAFPLLISIIDEFIQTFIPGRAGLVVDVLIDMIGVIIGFGLVFLIKFKRYNAK